jgi:hypothetical protein
MNIRFDEVPTDQRFHFVDAYMIDDRQILNLKIPGAVFIAAKDVDGDGISFPRVHVFVHDTHIDLYNIIDCVRVMDDVEILQGFLCV